MHASYSDVVMLKTITLCAYDCCSSNNTATSLL